MEIPGMPGASMGMLNLGDIFGKAMGGRTKKRRMTVAHSYEVLIAEESDKLLDEETVVSTAIAAAEQNGIVFLDEIDKITARSERRGADVSSQGVQRDLLPPRDGTPLATTQGPLRTDQVMSLARASCGETWDKPGDI